MSTLPETVRIFESIFLKLCEIELDIKEKKPATGYKSIKDVLIKGTPPPPLNK